MKSKHFIFLIIFGGIFYFLNCSAFIVHNLNYDISLAEVERPANVKERFGEHQILKTEEKGYKYLYEDEMIKILWLPTSKKIGFFIENKTDHSIRLIWDEAAYVDTDGETHKVIHAGVRYINRDAPQAPSVIVRHGILSDIIYPSDYIYYADGWHERPLFTDSQMGGNPMELLEAGKQYIGKTIQVLLPLEIEGVTNDYIFIFKINNVEMAGEKK